MKKKSIPLEAEARCVPRTKPRTRSASCFVRGEPSRPLTGPKILVVVGPTASGKSSLAIKIARHLSNYPRMKSNASRMLDEYSRKIWDNSSRIREYAAEIVSADSRQIYRGMDVGTGKVPLANSARIKTSNIREYSRAKFEKNSRVLHHLVDIKNPDEEYTVADYRCDAMRAIRAILRRGKLPILVGGTGFYIKAVIDNLKIPEARADAKLRKNLELRIKNKGLGSLVEELLRLDPEAAYIVDVKNPRRVVRALEVAIQTGKPFTAQRKKGPPLFDALEIGIKIPPEKLRRSIEKRVDEMISAGLVEEVRALLKKYGRTPVLINTIGYKEIIDHLENKISLSQAVELIKLNTWAYARRQMTWFKKDKKVRWIKGARAGQRLTENFLNRR